MNINILKEYALKTKGRKPFERGDCLGIIPITTPSPNLKNQLNMTLNELSNLVSEKALELYGIDMHYRINELLTILPSSPNKLITFNTWMSKTQIPTKDFIDFCNNIELMEFSPSNTDIENKARKEAMSRHYAQLENFQNIKLTTEKNSKTKNEVTNIYIIHGHDKNNIRFELATLLSSWGLKPIMTMTETSEGRTIIDAVDRDIHKSKYAIALFTPDDVGGVNDGKNNLSPRPRQNVVLETGIVMGKLGLKNVMLILCGHVDFPSDLQGIIYKKCDTSISNLAYGIMKELEKAKITIKNNPD